MYKCQRHPYNPFLINTVYNFNYCINMIIKICILYLVNSSKSEAEGSHSFAKKIWRPTMEILYIYVQDI